MASLKLSIAFDDPKKLTVSTDTVRFGDRVSVFAITGFANNVSSSRVCLSNSCSSSRAKTVRVSRLYTELSSNFSAKVDGVEGSETLDADDSVSEELIVDSSSNPKPFPQGINKGVRKSGNLKSFVRVSNGESDVSEFMIGPDLSIQECNSILKRLEQSNDDGDTMELFEWMRNSGKLKGNSTAYNLVLRVLSRREEWEMAKDLIGEMRDESGCELNFQVFNTLIYACCKKGQVAVGGKWFRMMLDYGVQPNIATFGMVMSLYKKSWSVEDAEFAFEQMRNVGIKCQSAYSAMITIYTRLRLYDKAESVIALAREDKVVLNLENWLVMVNAYSQQGKLEEAEEMMASMQKAGFPLNIVGFNMMITGYGKASKMDAAEQLFQHLLEVGLEPDETTYRSMIEGWGRADNYLKTIQYYKELKQLGLKPNASNMYTLINLVAKHGDEEGASLIVNDMVKMGCQYSSILGTLLQAYERAGRIFKVPLVLKGSFYQHVLVNQTSCSTLVIAYVKNHLIDDAINVLKGKKWKDTGFEDNLYHVLICSCKESGRLENAEKIFFSIPNSEGKQPNLHIYCTMIDIYCMMKRFDEAEALYMTLKSSNVALDVIGFSIVVRMYVKSGSLKDACSVLETMEKRKDIVPDIFLFRDMLRIYQQCDMKEKLQDVYYKLVKSGISWDEEVYNCVINCCSRALHVDELSKLFDEMLQNGFTPNTVTFNVMLDVYAKSKLFKKVRKLFLMARKQGWIDVVSYNTLIAAYGQNRDFKSMSVAIQEMKFDGFSVSLEAYNCMLDAYGKERQMESFKRVLQRMQDSGCASDHYTYNIMMNIYGEQGWIDEVASVLKELKEFGLGPDLCSYNTLIKAYGIAGMVEDAVGLIKEMREKEVQPDKITFLNLIAALKRNDKFLEAIRWSLWMKQMGL